MSEDLSKYRTDRRTTAKLDAGERVLSGGSKHINAKRKLKKTTNKKPNALVAWLKKL